MIRRCEEPRRRSEAVAQRCGGSVIVVAEWRPRDRRETGRGAKGLAKRVLGDVAISLLSLSERSRSAVRAKRRSRVGGTNTSSRWSATSPDVAMYVRDPAWRDEGVGLPRVGDGVGAISREVWGLLRDFGASPLNPRNDVNVLYAGHFLRPQYHGNTRLHTDFRAVLGPGNSAAHSGGTWGASCTAPPRS
jgi:hypothetical protein